jgi:mannose-1-phosphate guanylyltransferase
VVSVVAVVLAGGTGTRLFPASRSDRPKQFLDFGGGGETGDDGDDRSLLERTVARADFADGTLVVTRPAHEAGVRERVPDAEVLVEPGAKDTGPALALASHAVRTRFEDAVVVALPADHVVGDGFRSAMDRGVEVAAATDRLVTFGVDPTRPDTGYGYVELGAERDGWYELAAFHEKPDAETAKRYVAAGHRWNAGVFAWRPGPFLDAARASPLEPLVAALEAGDAAAGFDAVPAVSVDHAVLERTDDAAVVPASFEWDDLGSWDSFARVSDGDDDGNVTVGDVGALTLDASDNVVAADGRDVSLVGVSDLVVVAWDDHVLVVPKSEAQRVRDVARRRD